MTMVNSGLKGLKPSVLLDDISIIYILTLTTRGSSLDVNLAYVDVRF